jgi:hypothetical protein
MDRNHATIDVTLAEMLAGSLFYYEEIPLRMPGVYTPFYNYPISVNQSIDITFNITENKFGQFSFHILDGMAMTLSKEKFTPYESVKTPYGLISPNPSSETDKTVIFINAGIPVLLPSGDIVKSLLILDK